MSTDPRINGTENYTKYLWWIVFSLIGGLIVLIYGNSKIPARYSQEVLLTNPYFTQGIYENLRTLEEKIQKGDFKLADNVITQVAATTYRAAITKMTDQKKTIPYTKYHLEIHFFYPYTDIPRNTKLDTILVDVNPEQNHDFADLFWNLE